MDALEALLEELDGALTRIATTRATLEGQVFNASADVDVLLTRFETIGASIHAGLNHTEVFVSSVDTVLRPLAHDPPTGESAQSSASLNQLLMRLDAYAEEIIPAAATELMSNLAGARPDQLRDAIQAVADQHLQKFDDVLAGIEDKLATLVEASEQIVEVSTTFSETVAEVKETLVDKTSELAGSVKELVTTLDQLSAGGSEALSQKLTAELADVLSEKIELLTNGTLESVASFSNKAEQLTGKIVEQLSGITGKFEEVLDIVEPIKPVIELAGSMS